MDKIMCDLSEVIEITIEDLREAFKIQSEGGDLIETEKSVKQKEGQKIFSEDFRKV